LNQTYRVFRQVNSKQCQNQDLKPDFHQEYNYKNVIRTSETKLSDMLYNSKITFESTSSYSYKSMVWLDHADAKNNLYVVATGEDYNDANSPFLYIFNATNLVFKSQIALEKYTIPDNFGGGKFYESEPYFAFSNSAGNKVYVIAKATGLV
jgi:hypothetical protein